MSCKFLETPLSLLRKKICVAGANGMVGQALARMLSSEDCEVISLTRDDVDLRAQQDVSKWLYEYKPDILIVAAAKVGGIYANSAYPAEFIYDNIMIEANLIHSAYEVGVEKLLFLGSSCIYPREVEQPITSESLLAAPLEPTNQYYAIAKIAGVKMCEAYRKQYGCDFISAMPCNLYGPGDRYHEENSHVIPALLLKMYKAKLDNKPSVTLWGSGAPLREFLYVDDLAQGLIHILKTYSAAEPINIGSGEEVSIADLAELVAEVVGYNGDIIFDTDYPDGTPRKLLDSSEVYESGWTACTSLKNGIHHAYRDFLRQVEQKYAA